MNDAATDMALQRIVMKKKGAPGAVQEDIGFNFDDDEDDALIDNMGGAGDQMAADLPDWMKRKGLYDFPKPPPPKG